MVNREGPRLYAGEGAGPNQSLPGLCHQAAVLAFCAGLSCPASVIGAGIHSLVAGAGNDCSTDVVSTWALWCRQGFVVLRVIWWH